MFTDVGGEMSVCFTNITGATACTQKLDINNSQSQLYYINTNEITPGEISYIHMQK